jgi:hypothetical protein
MKRELTISDLSMVLEDGLSQESNEDIFEYIRKDRRSDDSEWNSSDGILNKILVEYVSRDDKTL